MTTPPSDWVQTALRVTGHFEDSADPLGGVTGDFDGMGISLGVLQWNIGSNSLQSMVRAVGREHVLATMPRYGEELWQACGVDVKRGLTICRGWQTGSRLKIDARAELKAFTRSEPFVGQQVARAGKVAETAFTSAHRFAGEDPSYGTPTKALFCWFFDVYTQNGGLKGLGYAEVSNFIGKSGGGGADDVICDWLAGCPKTMTGYRDSHSNAALWRDSIPADRLSLFVLSYLRAQLSRPAYKADVMNRKATIAAQNGWVHREKHDLSTLLK